MKLTKLLVSVIPEKKYLALNPRSPLVASVWKWTQSSGVNTTMGTLGMVFPQNLANCSPYAPPEGGGRKFEKVEKDFFYMCNDILTDLLKKVINQMQLIQNSAAYVVCVGLT